MEKISTKDKSSYFFMRYSVIGFLFLILTLNVTAQNSELKSREVKWAFFDLHDTTYAQVVSRSSGGLLPCGVFAFASMTIAKKSSGDIIRILELCESATGIYAGDKIKIIPKTKPDFGVTIPFNSAAAKSNERPELYDDRILKTCYGIIEAVKK